MICYNCEIFVKYGIVIKKYRFCSLDCLNKIFTTEDMIRLFGI